MKTLNSFQKLAISTVLATLFLIFVGSLVRTTGAGLGCPDWPKCFGMWIPPTAAEQLPASFDKSQFNVVKTWTEYINRLIGVFIGFLITATFILSFRYVKTQRAVFSSSFAAFILVLFQGWLGGQVVASELDEWLITIHMITALIIVLLLIFAVFGSSRDLFTINLSPSIRNILLGVNIVLLVLTLVQTGLGTQVRELIDFLNKNSDLPRSLWLAERGSIDEFHRSFSWLIVIATGINIAYNFKTNIHPKLKKTFWAVAVLVVLQIIYGIVLTYYGIPAVFQMLHLTFAAFLVCAEFLAVMMIYFSEIEINR